MIISAKIIIAVLLTIIIVGSAAYILYTNQPPSENTGNQETTTTSQPPTTTNPGNTETTTMPPQTTTTQQESTTSLQLEVAGYPEPRLTGVPVPPVVDPPVLANGVWHNFTYAKVRYVVTIGDETVGFNVTWSLTHENYTAVCYNYWDEYYVRINVSDAVVVKYSYVFDDGYWFNITIYLPNMSLIWNFNTLPVGAFDTFATPHGAQISVLGATVSSSYPENNGWWSSAQPLLTMEEAAKCRAVIEGNPEVDSLRARFTQLIFEHGFLSMFQPVEAFEALAESDWTGTITYIATGEGAPYNEGQIILEYLGEEYYADTGITMHIYNATITTDTNYITVHVTIAPESILPLEYHAYYPQGEFLEGTPTRVDMWLISAHLDNG